MPPVPAVRSPNRRLDSWKEIAAFFDRDERTVKRWEKERDLPVHRLPGGSRARVFAFTDELSQWMHSPPAEASAVDQESAIPDAEEIVPPAVDSPQSASGQAGTRWIPIAVIAVLLAAVLVVEYRHHGGQRTTERAAAAQRGAASGAAASASAPRPVDPAAQQLYLKGRYYWDKRTPADLNKAVDYFTQAIVRDPDYAQAYVGLANCYNLLREFAGMPSDEAFPRALAAAKKAVQLDDSSAEAHNALAFVTFYWNWDAADAEREFRRAIELNPNYGTAHHWYATFLLALGRYPEALTEIERAQQLDPASTPILADKALIVYKNGDGQEAITLLKQIDASQPDFFSTHRYLSYIYQTNGDYANYLKEALKSASLSHSQAEVAVVQAGEKGLQSGGREEMLRNILQTQTKFFEEGAFPAFALASTFVQLGDKAQAIRYLQISYQRHETEFLSILSSDPMVALRNEPAFQKLLAQAGLPQLK